MEADLVVVQQAGQHPVKFLANYGHAQDILMGMSTKSGVLHAVGSGIRFAGGMQVPAGQYEVVPAGRPYRTPADDVADWYDAAVQFLRRKGYLSHGEPHAKTS